MNTMESDEELKYEYNELRRLYTILRTVSQKHRERAENLHALNGKLVLELSSVKQENKALREEHIQDMHKLMKIRLELATAMNEISSLTKELIEVKNKK